MAAAPRVSAVSNARSGLLTASGKCSQPIQERRAKYEANPKLAWDILEAGSAKARVAAESTMEEVRAAANLSFEYEPPKASFREPITDARPTTIENQPAAPHGRESPQHRAKKGSDESSFSVMVSQVYDGPLDLLLDLIRKQDIDIYDIPIAKITAQYLKYVENMKQLDVDVAAEFIYTASLLIHIKSKMLLPRDPDATGATRRPAHGVGQPACSNTNASGPRRRCCCRSNKSKRRFGQTRP